MMGKSCTNELHSKETRFNTRRYREEGDYALDVSYQIEANREEKRTEKRTKVPATEFRATWTNGRVYSERDTNGDGLFRKKSEKNEEDIKELFSDGKELERTARGMQEKCIMGE